MIKKTAVINDLSGLGKCSLAAAIAVLSVMGVQPCALPTAILSNQTGYKKYCSCDFTRHMRSFADIWEQSGVSFDGIYSGYVANAEQLDIISDFIDRFKTPQTVVLVDTVLGDNGRMYDAYDASACRKMRRLAEKADIITPNLTELCILTETDYAGLTSHSGDSDYLERLTDLAQSAAERLCPNVIVTGINSGEFVLNGIFTRDGSCIEAAEKYGGSFSGTGDIFASIVFGYAVKGKDLRSAVKAAAGFIETAAADTVQADYDRNDGVNFEKYLYTLGGNNE